MSPKHPEHIEEFGNVSNAVHVPKVPESATGKQTNRLGKRLFRRHRLQQHFAGETLYRTIGHRKVSTDELFLDLIVVANFAALGRIRHLAFVDFLLELMGKSSRRLPQIVRIRRVYDVDRGRYRCTRSVFEMSTLGSWSSFCRECNTLGLVGDKQRFTHVNSPIDLRNHSCLVPGLSISANIIDIDITT